MSLRRTDIRPDDNHLPPAVRLAVRHLKEHYVEDVSLTDIARAARMSKFRLAHLFKEATGLPPGKYRMWLRIEEAKRMFKEEPYTSVTEAAVAVGYSSLYALEKAFHHFELPSPSEYRKAIASEQKLPKKQVRRNKQQSGGSKRQSSRGKRS